MQEDTETEIHWSDMPPITHPTTQYFLRQIAQCYSYITKMGAI